MFHKDNVFWSASLAWWRNEAFKSQTEKTRREAIEGFMAARDGSRFQRDCRAKAQQREAELNAEVGF